MHALNNREPLRILSKIIQLFSLTKNLNREQWSVVYKDLWGVVAKEISLLFKDSPPVQIWQIDRKKISYSPVAGSTSGFSNSQIIDRSSLADKGSIFDIDDTHFLYIQIPFNELTEDHKTLLSTIVEHLRVSYEWRTSLERGFEIQKRMDLLHKITASIRGTLDLPEVLANTACDLGESLEVSRCFIRRYDPNNPGTVLATEQEYTEPSLMRASDTIFDFETDWMKNLSKKAEEAINQSDENFESNILYIKNAEELDDPEGWVTSMVKAIQLKTFLGIPLIYQGMTVGSLCFHQCDSERYFDSNEFEFIKQVADEASVAIVHAEMYKHIQLQAKTDALTGLHNKASFHELINQEIERAKRTQSDLSVMMIDLDFLKTANDTYGHIIGDEMIKLMGSKLKQVLRQVDICARFGGDEFGAILPDTPLEGARQLATRLAEEVKATKHPIAGPMSASIGVSGTTHNQLEKEHLIEEADKALYLAKRKGKGQACSSEEIEEESKEDVTKSNIYESEDSNDIELDVTL